LVDARSDREGLAKAAFDLYRELVGGRWVLEKRLYLFYASTARKWLTANGAPAADVARWMTVEDQKQLLTDAVAGVFDGALLQASHRMDSFSCLGPVARAASFSLWQESGCRRAAFGLL
jgi:hypothetical protein